MATAEWGVAICVRFPVTRWKLIRNALGMFLRCYFGRKYLLLSEGTLECVTIRTGPLRPGCDRGRVPGRLPKSERPGSVGAFSLPSFLMAPCSSSEGPRFLASVLSLIQPERLLLKASGQSGHSPRRGRMQETVPASSYSSQVRIGFWGISLKIFFIWNVPIFTNMD